MKIKLALSKKSKSESIIHLKLVQWPKGRLLKRGLKAKQCLINLENLALSIGLIM